MGPKTILVCLTTPENAEPLMKAAVMLARKHDAHLIGLHTIESLVVYPGIAMHVPDTAFAAFHESQREDSEAIKKVFAEQVRSDDIVSEFRLLRADGVSAGDRMVECARGADLVIMAREDRENDRYDQRHVQVQVIRESGRPVMIVPLDYNGADIGENLLVGWSDTRESARAVHDMLHIADDGAKITILRVDSKERDGLADGDGLDIAGMLARHGFKCSLDHRAPLGKTIAAVLCDVALEKGAGAIVTGAFGHSRTYDFVIGATSYELLREATVPVLFSK